MRNGWWMAPVAVLLVLAGVAAGLLLSRPRVDLAGNGARVHAPALPGEQAAGGAGGGVRPPAAGSAPAQPPVAGEPATGPKRAEPARPADSAARSFVAEFMQARMAGDPDRLGSMVAPGAPGKGGIRISSGAHRIIGYTATLLGSGDSDSFVFRLSVAFATGQPGGEVAAENVRVTWKDGFKVAAFEEAARDTLALGADKEGKLQLHRGQDTALMGDLAQLPATARPWGSSDAEFGVGKDGWAVATPSLSGDVVLWATRGLHPLLGVSYTNWQGAPKVVPLDLLFESSVLDAAWAPGADHLVAVVVARPSAATTLLLYDLGGARFGPDLSTVLGSEDYTVRQVRWLSGTTVAFDLVKGGAPAGTWTYNVQKRSLQAP